MVFCTHEALSGNIEKSSKLYDHCERFITSAQFVKFLDSLEHSGNLPALRILDPDRKLNPIRDPDNVKIVPLEQTHIRTFDVARIFHDKTNLPADWTILEEALQLNAGQWAEVVRMQNTNKPLRDIFKFILDTWSAPLGHLGEKRSTVGVVYDSLCLLDRRGDAGKEDTNSMTP
jgi:hypothetical protein